jgi:hypothetical protein
MRNKSVLPLTNLAVTVQVPYTLPDGKVMPTGTTAVISDPMLDDLDNIKVTFEGVEGEHVIDTHNFTVPPSSIRALLRSMVDGFKDGGSTDKITEYYILGPDYVPVKVDDENTVRHWVIDNSALLDDVQVGDVKMTVDFVVIYRHPVDDKTPPKLFEIKTMMDGEVVRVYRRATYDEAMTLHKQIIHIYSELDRLVDSLPKE